MMKSLPSLKAWAAAILHAAMAAFVSASSFAICSRRVLAAYLRLPVCFCLYCGPSFIFLETIHKQQHKFNGLVDITR